MLCISVLFLYSCDINNSSGDNSEIIRELPRSLAAEEQSISEGSNEFAFRLLHKLQSIEGDSSFFISPLSISTAYGMLYNGAEEETYVQLQDFFGHNELSKEEINQGYKNLIELLINLDDEVIVNIANSIWSNEDASIKQDFVSKNKEFFNAEVDELDFTDPNSANIINKWVEDRTDGLIDKIVASTNPQEVIYLLNAIYFKGDWTTQFDPQDTSEEPFYLPGGETTTVSLMQNVADFRVASDENWKSLDMWYGKSGYSFTVLVPLNDQPLPELIPELTIEKFTNLTSNLEKKENVSVALPRFELKYEIPDFKNVLIDMGLNIPFNQNAANLSGIADVPQLHISNTRHKAVIKVDEKGTEAAAATSIVASSSLNSFRLDRPFLFFIRENNSNTILFMGSYTGITK